MSDGEKKPLATCNGDVSWHLRMVDENARLTRLLNVAVAERDEAKCAYRNLNAGLEAMVREDKRIRADLATAEKERDEVRRIATTAYRELGARDSDSPWDEVAGLLCTAAFSTRKDVVNAYARAEVAEKALREPPDLGEIERLMDTLMFRCSSPHAWQSERNAARAALLTAISARSVPPKGLRERVEALIKEIECRGDFGSRWEIADTLRAALTLPTKEKP